MTDFLARPPEKMAGASLSSAPARREFVARVFEIAALYDFCSNTAAMAVRLGDHVAAQRLTLEPVAGYTPDLAALCAVFAAGFHEELHPEYAAELFRDEWIRAELVEVQFAVLGACGWNLCAFATPADAAAVFCGRPLPLGAARALCDSPAFAVSPGAWLAALILFARRRGRLPAIFGGDPTPAPFSSGGDPTPAPAPARSPGLE